MATVRGLVGKQFVPAHSVPPGGSLASLCHCVRLLVSEVMRDEPALPSGASSRICRCSKTSSIRHRATGTLWSARPHITAIRFRLHPLANRPLAVASTTATAAFPPLQASPFILPLLDRALPRGAVSP